MWIINKCFKIYDFNNYEGHFDFFYLICVVQPDKKQILNELD